jgi:hypothetical protein
MSSLSRHPDWDVTITGSPPNLSSKYVKTGKNHKYVKTGNDPKTTLSQFLKNQFCISAGCFGPFPTFRTQNGRVFHILHAAKVCITGISLAKMENTGIFFYIRYDNVRINLEIWYLTYCCVANRLQPFLCLNSFSFMSFHVYKVSLDQFPQQK